MPAEKVDIEIAKKEKLFYVVANVVPIRKDDGKALILKRSESEKVYPGKWAVIGGKMEHGDFDLKTPTRIENNVLVYEDPLLRLLTREAREEAGIKIEEPLMFIDNKLIIRPDGIPVNLMSFAARYAGGEIALEIGSFTEFAWVDGDEIDNYDCIEGVKQEVKKALSIFAYAGYIENKKQ